MRWTFDGEADALYIRLHEGTSERQVELADGLMVDLVGTEVLGVEVLTPSQGWSADPVVERFHLGPEDREALKLMERATRTIVGSSIRSSRPPVAAGSSREVTLSAS